MAEDAIEHVDQPNVCDDAQLPHDPMAALDRLTQLNGSSASAGANACGAVSLVAAVLAVHGYAGLRALAASLRDELADDVYSEIEGLAVALSSGSDTATYGALADYALIVHRRYRGWDGGMPYDKLLHLMKLAGFQPPRALDDDTVAGTNKLRGQCWPAKIAMESDEGDHWIMVGQDLKGPFIYDPYPRQDGSQIIRPWEGDWKKYAAAIGKDEEGQDTIGFLPA
jgi:hypothetical protein